MDSACPLCTSPKRTLLTSADLVQCPRCGLVAAANGDHDGMAGTDVDLVQRVASLASGYAAAGQRLAVLGAKPESFPTSFSVNEWEVTAEPELLAGRDDAALLLNIESESEPVVRLRSIHGALNDCGLLLLPVIDASRVRTPHDARRLMGPAGRFLFTAQTTHAVLHRAGFRVVEWTRLPGLSGAAGTSLAIARPN